MDHLQHMIAKHFGLDQLHVTDHLMNDLGGDALDIIELVMLLEEKYNISISDDEAENFITVQDVCDCVRAKTLEGTLS